MSSITKFGCLACVGWTALAASAASPPAAKVPASEVSHRLRLTSFALPAVPSPIGLLISARINNGPPMHLLLDSGARYLVLDKKTAAHSGCTGGAIIDLVGAGGSSQKMATTVKAGAVQLGSLILRNVDIAIVEGRVIDGVDGVLPLALFEQYLIRLDMPAKSLELSAYPADPVSTTDSSAVFRQGLVFVKGLLNEKHEGYFLLDTGASYNAISTKLAEQMNSSRGPSPSLPLQSGVARMDGPILQNILRLRIGARDLQADPAVSVDLSMASRYFNMEISGLLGYPAIRNSVVTVNYRDSLVHIERK